LAAKPGHEVALTFVRGKPSKLHKLAFELRYRFGYTYLDRCGKTLNIIMKEAPEWVLKNELVNPQGAGLASLANQCSFNFSSQKLEFSLEQSAMGEIAAEEFRQFSDQVELLTTIVTEQLGLKEFTRIGLRSWYLFPCRSKAESERWLAELGLFNVSESLMTAYQAEVEAVGVSIVLAGVDRKFRIALNGAERSALLDLGSEVLSVRTSGLSKQAAKFTEKPPRQKARLRAPAEFLAMIDIDAYQEDPVAIEPRDFIETSESQALTRLIAAVHKD
jgi:hypothetical protein